jgi:hypothetical protein
MTKLSKPDHKIHGLCGVVKDRIADACEFCAGAPGVKDKVASCGVCLMGDYDGHPSFKKPVSRGYQAITI